MVSLNNICFKAAIQLEDENSWINTESDDTFSARHKVNGNTLIVRKTTLDFFVTNNITDFLKVNISDLLYHYITKLFSRPVVISRVYIANIHLSKSLYLQNRDLEQFLTDIKSKIKIKKCSITQESNIPVPVDINSFIQNKPSFQAFTLHSTFGTFKIQLDKQDKLIIHTSFVVTLLDENLIILTEYILQYES